MSPRRRAPRESAATPETLTSVGPPSASAVCSVGIVAGSTGINAVPAPGQKAYLAIAFDTSSHYLEWSTSWGDTDVKLDSTPRGPMGPPNDYNLDGVADLMYTNGNSSELLVGYDWAGESDDQRERLETNNRETRLEVLEPLLVLLAARRVAAGKSVRDQILRDCLVDDLEAALEQFRLIANDLGGESSETTTS